jgi:hypothetical protein
MEQTVFFLPPPTAGKYVNGAVIGYQVLVGSLDGGVGIAATNES